MIEGDSGILSVCPPWNRPTYEPSKRRLIWPNGTVAHVYSAFEPNNLRGPQHHWAWADELASWKKLPSSNDPDDVSTDSPWDMLALGLRLGDNPQCVVTTTPKPIPLIKAMVEDSTVVVTKGNTYENINNLSEAFIRDIKSRYEGTSIGRQEIYAEILDEVKGALWTRKVLDVTRVSDFPDLPKLAVGVDPSGGVAEIGIVTVGLGTDKHLYVLADASLRASPDGWGREVLSQYNLHSADRVVAEKNYGGQMVEHVMRTVAKDAGQSIAYKGVDATRGKAIRAEPVAALFEQGKAHMVGTHPLLEGELTSWVPGDKNSPNRLDAMVWACHYLVPMYGTGDKPFAFL